VYNDVLSMGLDIFLLKKSIVTTAAPQSIMVS